MNRKELLGVIRSAENGEQMLDLADKLAKLMAMEEEEEIVEEDVLAV